MMADDQALQGQLPHLANGGRGRSQLLPYQPHGFTGYEPNRPASMPSTPRRHGEAPGPPQESTLVCKLECLHQGLGLRHPLLS